MPNIILLAVGVPVALAVVHRLRRNRPLRSAADSRGIALQTVIIMVVLLAIAGAVAGVLLSQGQEAVTQVEQQDVTQDLSDFDGNELWCEAMGGELGASNNCVPKST